MSPAPPFNDQDAAVATQSWLNRPGFRHAAYDLAYPGAAFRIGSPQTREQREDYLVTHLNAGATFVKGAGNRRLPEAPDPVRTCFERDRDRILHSLAFRRLAEKTQVFAFPNAEQRTRLTHTLEVAQIARGLAEALGLNTALVEAQALAHDCGHTPGGHAGEEAFATYLPEGFNHAIWGAEVTLLPLNLCQETLDGVRNHSWSQPRPQTPEGALVRYADRFAYACHDLVDAVQSGLIPATEIPASITSVLGNRQSRQIGTLMQDVVDTAQKHQIIGLSHEVADALSALRTFNYEKIYRTPMAQAQMCAVVKMLRALVEYYLTHPETLPPLPPELDEIHAIVAHLSAMTDPMVCRLAVDLLQWPLESMPHGFFPLTEYVDFGNVIPPS